MVTKKTTRHHISVSNVSLRWGQVALEGSNVAVGLGNGRMWGVGKPWDSVFDKMPILDGVSNTRGPLRGDTVHVKVASCRGSRDMNAKVVPNYGAL